MLRPSMVCVCVFVCVCVCRLVSVRVFCVWVGGWVGWWVVVFACVCVCYVYVNGVHLYFCVP